MSLAFLSKKSFHTATIKNQEKVWIAEQKKAVEESKTRELERQIQIEREKEEMERITGTKKKNKDRGIDWMYAEGGGVIEKEETEEYLLGKEFNSTIDQGGIKGVESCGVDKVIQNAAERVVSQVNADFERGDLGEGVEESLQEEEEVDRNEEFRRRYEDPMFLVNFAEYLDYYAEDGGQ